MPSNYTLDEDLRAFILANSSIAAIIGTRLNPLRIEQNATLPASAYELEIAKSIDANDGPTGLYQSLLTITCVGEKYGDVVNLSWLMSQALNNFQGSMGNTEIKLMTYDGSTPDFDEEAKVYLMSLNFTITHK